MIGPRPCVYACVYVDLVFTSQSYDLVRFSCAYAYAYALEKTRL